MGYPQTVERLLPEREAEIRQLRHTCTIFDEICCDYEIITELERNGNENDPAVMECLEELNKEILKHLGHLATGTQRFT